MVDARIAAGGGAIRLNLGCGEKNLPGYINVDRRDGPGVDVVADACDLPFVANSVAEIFAAHLAEHFRRHDLETRVLPYWKSLLAPGGVLRVIVPNGEEMLRRVHDGHMTLEEFSRITFGAQDYEGDDHFAMYTPALLESVLRKASFATATATALDRMNGGCPEMEFVATA